MCFLPAANFVRDKDIIVDISLASDPVIKGSYIESHHKVKYPRLLRARIFSGHFVFWRAWRGWFCEAVALQPGLTPTCSLLCVRPGLCLAMEMQMLTFCPVSLLLAVANTLVFLYRALWCTRTTPVCSVTLFSRHHC